MIFQGPVEVGAEAFVQVGGFAEGFRESGVGVNGAGEVGGGGVGFEGQSGFGNQIAGSGTRDGDAQQLAGAGIGEDFRDAVGAAERKRGRWPPRGTWKP